ncbi:expressed unknown protein [Seminavis robusta]|uniref:Uncharacterized protein n=1 Tax=Seminavis robusta TaxID=568900 RepID=A0A9N8ENI5_9STRA|nr:expressed unknown protein [Seminavis robusta]|eukprot:Sro1530_g280040.1 n/a (785) ;mRNA; f:129-2724
MSHCDRLCVQSGGVSLSGRLQTRFFELGMNYYLGMEFAREFDKLKNDAAKELVKDAREHAPQATKTAVARLRFSIMHAIDRLWYEACLEVIQEGDVYNPGGRANIPQLYTIDSPLEDNLGDLPVAEACVLARRPWVVTGADGASVMARLESGQKSFPLPVDTPVNELKRDTKTTLKSLKNNDRFIPLASFEILFRAGGYSIVRNTSGFIVKMPNDVKVHRLSDLSRGVDGYSESKVALAAFPVAHVVCNRAVKLNVKTPKALEGYMMAFVGDGQASPHFMRYSGLTGACINCMSFNNMIGQAVAGIDYKARVQRYGLETNWSNGEVVQRGTGANYGEDGFLRPGFTYTLLVDYLYQKAQEYHETGLIMEQNILSRDWKIKMAASLVPRGLENDSVYLSAMIGELRNVLKQKFEDGVKLEMNMNDMNETEMSRIDSDLDLYFEAFKGTSPALERYSSDTSMFIKFTTDALADAINYSLELRADNKRFTSEMFTQPKPVDSIVDDFAVEAQNFANSLTQSVAFAVAAAGLAVVDGAGAWASLVSGLFSIWFAFGTMTNVSRYKNRNEEHRRYYAEKKFLKVQKAVFSLLRRDQRESMMFEENPYAVDLDNLANEFIYKAGYYGYSDAVVQSFKDAYAEFKAAIHNDGAAAKFMRAVVGDFIPKTFHANSYLQEQLVMIYAATNEIRQGRTQGGQIQGGETGDVLDMLKTFKPKLEASLESQAISYGFFKRRKFSQWAVVVSIRYFLSFFFPSSARCWVPDLENPERDEEDSSRWIKQQLPLQPRNC